MNKFEEIMEEIGSLTSDQKILENCKVFVFWLWERHPHFLDDVLLARYFDDGILLEWATPLGKCQAEIRNCETRYLARLVDKRIFSEHHPLPIKVVDDVADVLRTLYGEK